jgi:hypothetical protein
LSDYSNKMKKPFTHLAAWEVVKNEARWLEVPVVGGQTSSSHSDKRKKSSEGGNYESGNENEPVLPDLNDDNAPPRQRKGKKSAASEVSSKTTSTFVESMEMYTARKAAHMDEVNEKTKELLDLKLERTRKKVMRDDQKFFNSPHDHITDPVQLGWTLNQKREIGEKYGWRCDF